MNNWSVALIWDVVIFPQIRNIYTKRFSSIGKSFAPIDSNYSILNAFISCGGLFPDVVTNLEHNQHEPVTLNLESSRTCHSLLTRGVCNQTLLTCIKIYFFSECNVDCRRQRSYFQRNQFNFIFNTVYVGINTRISPNRIIFGRKDPVLWLNSWIVI